jgi:glutamyl-Q tRNA(Asp) synthetase
MEDLDPPREEPGAATRILGLLESLGMMSDEPVEFQSRRVEFYENALQTLQEKNCIYPCGCTRKEIADSTSSNNTAAAYPGTCRNGLPPGREGRSLRLRVSNIKTKFGDLLQGPVTQQLATEVGDFIVRRADHLAAYQLAVVVDDAAQDITHVVRGADLLGSTPRQIYLQQQLGLSTPAYLHLPVAVNPANEKLSKQTHAEAINDRDKNRLLLDTLNFLGQNAPAGLIKAATDEVWAWAIAHWQRKNIPAVRTRPAPAGYIQRQ